VAALHRHGIVHGSLGSGSFMVNTLDEARAASLVVKVDNLGFGQVFTGACGWDSALEKGKRGDREALAVTFLELTFCARSPSQTSLRHAESLPVVFVGAWNLPNTIADPVPREVCLHMVCASLHTPAFS
jgi:hypothetical protein